MKKIKLIELKSELGAGTRGASLGVDALKIASLNKKSNFFSKFQGEEVANKNELLFTENKFDYAKNINGVLAVEKNICEKVSETLEKNLFPIVLAGDHSTAYGTIAGIKKQNPNLKLGVIWIDAHADLHSPFTTPSGNMHGMPLAMALADDNKESAVNAPSDEVITLWEDLKDLGINESKINHEDIVFIGVRDTETPEDNIIQKHNITNIKVESVRENGSQWAVDTALLTLKNCDLIYVSFDIDSLDSDIAQGTGTPVPNGLTIEEVKTINSLFIKNEKVCCWEMVEVNPTLDNQQNKMAEIAFDVLEEVVKSYENR